MLLRTEVPPGPVTLTAQKLILSTRKARVQLLMCAAQTFNKIIQCLWCAAAITQLQFSSSQILIWLKQPDLCTSRIVVAPTANVSPKPDRCQVPCGMSGTFHAQSKHRFLAPSSLEEGCRKPMLDVCAKHTCSVAHGCNLFYPVIDTIVPELQLKIFVAANDKFNIDRTRV